MYKLICRDDCSCFKPDETTKITDYVTKENFGELSIVLSEINGDHGEFIYHGGVQFYFVIKGKVTFIFDDKKMILHEGDCIQIFNEWHRKIGEDAKMIVISTPAFDRTLEEIR